MANEVAYLTLGLVPFVALLFVFVRRWRLRNHVWVDMELKQGKVRRKLVIPNANGTISTEWGVYLTKPDAFTLFKERPLFRYRQGSPLPIKYTTKRVMSENPGRLIEITNPEPQVIPAETLEVFMKQKLFADAYSKSLGIIIVLILGFLVIALLIIGLYVQK